MVDDNFTFFTLVKTLVLKGTTQASYRVSDITNPEIYINSESF